MNRRLLISLSVAAALVLVFTLGGSPATAKRHPRKPHSSPTPSPTITLTTSPSPSSTVSPSPSSSVCSGVRVASGGSIQAAINANPSGTTFCLSGTYTPSSLTPKVNDVFMGGKLVGNGAAHAFNSSASGVTLDGIEVTGYAPVHYQGAVQISGAGWTVRNSYLHHNTGGSGLHWIGSGTHVLNNRFLYNGEEGFSAANDTGSIFSGNEVGWNNTSHQSWKDEAGGGKFYKSTNLTVTNNYSHDNDGPGLWCDTNCYNVVFDGNRLVDNVAAGIDYEISYDAIIRNNISSGNGSYHSGSAWYGSASILVESSQNVQVYGNTSTSDGNGIVLLEESRGSGNRGLYEVKNVSVHDNTTTTPIHQAAGLWNELSDSSYFSTKGNSFTHNSYRAASGCSCFMWSSGLLTWDQWRRAGQDTAGTFTPV